MCADFVVDTSIAVFSPVQNLSYKDSCSEDLR